MRLTPILLVLALAAGCSSDPQPRLAANAPTEIPQTTTGNFNLYVSNQSFDRPTVDIAVWIDGNRAVARDFEVEGQHNWIAFTFDLAPGSHQIRAGSDTGNAGLAEAFVTGERNWAVLQYWCCGEPEDPRFTWDLTDKPVAFA